MLQNHQCFRELQRVPTAYRLYGDRAMAAGGLPAAYDDRGVAEGQRKSCLTQLFAAGRDPTALSGLQRRRAYVLFRPYATLAIGEVEGPKEEGVI
jgi:hypothetical protein